MGKLRYSEFESSNHKKRVNMGPGYNYYESPADYQYEPDCQYCSEKGNAIEVASIFLTKIMDQLYSDKEFQEFNFESDLDELCFALGVKINPEQLKIQRTKTQKVNFISDLIMLSAEVKSC